MFEPKSVICGKCGKTWTCDEIGLRADLQRAREALKMADTALVLAVSFMAGVYERRGLKPAKYEKSETWVKINNPRLAIEALLAALEATQPRETNLAAAQQAQRDAEAERDGQACDEAYKAGQAVARLQDAANRWQARAEAAEAELQRAREALHEYHNADRGRWGQLSVPATECHNEECRRAAPEATQPRETN